MDYQKNRKYRIFNGVVDPDPILDSDPRIKKMTARKLFNTDKFCDYSELQTVIVNFPDHK
jgi:hypothetical protein